MTETTTALLQTETKKRKFVNFLICCSDELDRIAPDFQNQAAETILKDSAEIAKQTAIIIDENLNTVPTDEEAQVGSIPPLNLNFRRLNMEYHDDITPMSARTVYRKLTKINWKE